MRDGACLAVVVPCYNEERTIRRVLEALLALEVVAEILVVDDGSTDRTGEVARVAGAVVAALPYNLGVGGAMRVGFRYAVENGFGTVVQIDADGQHDPAGVSALLKALDSADLVLGARFAGKGAYRVRGPRRWAMSVLAVTLSRAAHTRLTDTTSGFRASGPRAVELFARHYPAEYLGDTIESLVIAARAGLVVSQVPVAMRPRAGGTPSQDPFKAAAYLARAVLALGFAFMRPKSLYKTVR
jgi:glycosyltransferase involved in cell wall biosynthesis